MKAKKLIVFSLIVLFILSLVANIYFYNENRRLENEKILLSNGYIEKHAELLQVRISDVENIDIANDLVQLEKFIRACEESTMYYQVSVQPLQGKKSLIKGFNSNLLTVSEYRMRIDKLRGYYHSKLSGKTSEEVTAKDVEIIISDFKTISNWLQERMKVKQMYYYDDGEFETEVLPQLLWKEPKSDKRENEVMPDLKLEIQNELDDIVQIYVNAYDNSDGTGHFDFNSGYFSGTSLSESFKQSGDYKPMIKGEAYKGVIPGKSIQSRSGDTIYLKFAYETVDGEEYIIPGMEIPVSKEDCWDGKVLKFILHEQPTITPCE